MVCIAVVTGCDLNVVGLGSTVTGCDKVAEDCV